MNIRSVDFLICLTLMKRIWRSTMEHTASTTALEYFSLLKMTLAMEEPSLS